MARDPGGSFLIAAGRHRTEGTGAGRATTADLFVRAASSTNEQSYTSRKRAVTSAPVVRTRKFAAAILRPILVASEVLHGDSKAWVDNVSRARRFPSWIATICRRGFAQRIVPCLFAWQEHRLIWLGDRAIARIAL